MPNCWSFYWLYVQLAWQVDGLSDDRKSEAQRDIHQRATDDLADAGLDGIHLSFYLTSIYDHSIFEVGVVIGLGEA